MIRLFVTFYGRVQGVGFRYHANDLANQLQLTGWVRNTSEGSVDMEIQGDRRNIESLLERIQLRPFVRVDRMTRYERPLIEEKAFRTVY